MVGANLLMVASAVGIVIDSPEVSVTFAAVDHHRGHVRPTVQVVAVAEVCTHRQAVGMAQVNRWEKRGAMGERKKRGGKVGKVGDQ